MNATLALFSVPLMSLNILGGAVSVIWLAILGEWRTIGYGLIPLISGIFVLSFALLPSTLLVKPVAYFVERGKPPFLIYPFVFLTLLYLIALMTAWCGSILYFFVSHADANSLIPSFIWSFFVAFGPWQFLAVHDIRAGAGNYSSLTVVFGQIGYLIMMVMVAFGTDNLTAPE